MKQEMKEVADAIEVAADRLVDLLNRADDLAEEQAVMDLYREALGM